VWLQYDIASARWRVTGGGAGSSPIGSPGDAYALGSPLWATETVDFTNGTWQYGTLDQDCTISFTGFTAGKDDGLTLEISEDGTGGWTPTLSGVTWIGGTPTWDTTAGTTTLVGILSRDGGTTILAGVIGGSTVSTGTPALTFSTTNATGAATTVIATDATIAVFDATVPVTQALGDTAATGSAGKAARRDHKHGMPALSTATPLVESGAGSAGSGTLSSRDDHVHPAATASAAHYLVIASSHSTPLVFDDIVQNSAGDDFVYTT
jgi:hypothetical protein